MNAADRRRLSPMLGIVAVLLAALLIALWAGLGRQPRWHGHAAPPRLAPLGATLPPPTVPPLAHFDAVWRHPLFNPDRRPEALAGAEADTSGDLQLTGVIMLPGLKLAIVHDKTTGKDYQVRAGQSPKSGPVLLELHPRSAVVDASGSHLQLQLIPGPAPDSGAAPAAASSQPGAPVAMVPRRSGESRNGSARAQAALAAARARALKARIEAERQRARQHDGGG